jgi:hypothetical protein
MAQGEETFPFQAQLRLLITLLMRPRTQSAAWSYIKDHWDFIMQRAPFLTPRIVEISGILPDTLRADVVTFWDAHLHGEYAGPYARALEQMDQNAELRARTRGDLLAYFTS